jgi:hypothetical protein
MATALAESPWETVDPFKPPSFNALSGGADSAADVRALKADQSRRTISFLNGMALPPFLVAAIMSGDTENPAELCVVVCRATSTTTHRRSRLARRMLASRTKTMLGRMISPLTLNLFKMRSQSTPGRLSSPWDPSQLSFGPQLLRRSSPRSTSNRSPRGLPPIGLYRVPTRTSWEIAVHPIQPRGLSIKTRTIRMGSRRLYRLLRFHKNPRWRAC